MATLNLIFTWRPRSLIVPRCASIQFAYKQRLEHPIHLTAQMNLNPSLIKTCMICFVVLRKSDFYPRFSKLPKLKFVRSHICFPSLEPLAMRSPHPFLPKRVHAVGSASVTLDPAKGFRMHCVRQ